MAMIGKGTVLSVSPDGTTYTAIAQLVDVKPPPPKVSKVETTDYDDTIIQHIPGWLDAGEAEAKIKYAKTANSTIYGYLSLSKFWKVVYPDGGNETFQGFLSEFGKEVPIKDKIVTTVKIVATTVPVFSAT